MKSAISWGLTGAVVFACLLAPALSIALTYGYTDELGVTHFTNRKEDIPDNYRQSAVEIAEIRNAIEYKPAAREAESDKGTAMEKISEGFSGIVRKAKGLVENVVALMKTGTSDIISLIIAGVAASIVIYALSHIFIRHRPTRYAVMLLSIACVGLVLSTLYLRSEDSGLTDSLKETNSLTEKRSKALEGVSGR